MTYKENGHQASWTLSVRHEIFTGIAQVYTKVSHYLSSCLFNIEQAVTVFTTIATATDGNQLYCCIRSAYEDQPKDDCV